MWLLYPNNYRKLQCRDTSHRDGVLSSDHVTFQKDFPVNALPSWWIVCIMAWDFAAITRIAPYCSALVLQRCKPAVHEEQDYCHHQRDWGEAIAAGAAILGTRLLCVLTWTVTILHLPITAGLLMTEVGHMSTARIPVIPLVICLVGTAHLMRGQDIPWDTNQAGVVPTVQVIGLGPAASGYNSKITSVIQYTWSWLSLK